ncbi:hypothetical protein SAMN05880566_14114 [Janthinobacterium sp. TND4EL3]|nr:hypothetical protein [Janthinobacterium sp. TND4EL3]SIR90908.1 hypothetical protein SAMN05880566_14114 [Janthinobacterium sp. TND4EL3]
MAFSCTDFTDNIINFLIGHGVLNEAEFEPDDPESQSDAATAALTNIFNGKAKSASFMQELLDAHETLTGIGEEHGVRTLADCMYMLSALQKGTYIEVHHPSESKILDVIQGMPSAAVWMIHVQEVTE